MKRYPSVLHMMPNNTEFYFWDKLDGQNTRIEWNNKKGWFKYGSKTVLVDRNDEHFKKAFDVFHQDGGLADKLDDFFNRRKHKNVTIFCEYWGPKSFVGIHEPEDDIHMTLLDMAIDKKGFLAPEEFLYVIRNELYLKPPEVPRYLGKKSFTSDFRQQVFKKEIEGITNEGVVGKSLAGNELILIKLKTQDWIESVKSRYDQARAEHILRS